MFAFPSCIAFINGVSPPSVYALGSAPASFSRNLTNSRLSVPAAKCKGVRPNASYIFGSAPHSIQMLAKTKLSGTSIAAMICNAACFIWFSLWSGEIPCDLNRFQSSVSYF